MTYKPHKPHKTYKTHKTHMTHKPQLYYFSLNITKSR